MGRTNPISPDQIYSLLPLAFREKMMNSPDAKITYDLLPQFFTPEGYITKIYRAESWRIGGAHAWGDKREIEWRTRMHWHLNQDGEQDGILFTTCSNDFFLAWVSPFTPSIKDQPLTWSISLSEGGPTLSVTPYPLYTLNPSKCFSQGLQEVLNGTPSSGETLDDFTSIEGQDLSIISLWERRKIQEWCQFDESILPEWVSDLLDFPF